MLELLKKGAIAILKPFLVRMVRSLVIDTIKRLEAQKWMKGVDLPEEQIADAVIAVLTAKGDVVITTDARIAVQKVLNNSTTA
jgi:uncharacterized protein YaiI (UPF0178 family)